MTLDHTSDLIGLALGLIALMGAVIAWARWIRPRYRAGKARIIGAVDALVGRDAIHDSITGKEIAPPLPGMGQRMAAMETAVTNLADLAVSQSHQDERITEAHLRINALETRVDSLETGRVEQVVTKAESVAAYRAMEAIAKHGDDADI